MMRPVAPMRIEGLGEDGACNCFNPLRRPQVLCSLLGAPSRIRAPNVFGRHRAPAFTASLEEQVSATAAFGALVELWLAVVTEGRACPASPHVVLISLGRCLLCVRLPEALRRSSPRDVRRGDRP